MTPLTGEELLKVVTSNVDADKNTLLEKAGYFTEGSDGKKSYKATEFYRALLEAQGIELEGFKPKASGGAGTGTGRKLPYKTTVQKNGSVVVGAGYFRAHDIPVGTALRIETKNGSIRLTPTKVEN